jgi:hypothetical protein
MKKLETYSIPIYENGIKTEWTVDGVVGDDKYEQLIQITPEGKLPDMINEMKKLETCHHCGEEKENCYHGYIAMTIPIPEAEAKKEKWGGEEWWKNLERDRSY